MTTPVTHVFGPETVRHFFGTDEPMAVALVNIPQVLVKSFVDKWRLPLRMGGVRVELRSLPLGEGSERREYTLLAVWWGS